MPSERHGREQQTRHFRKHSECEDASIEMTRTDNRRKGEKGTKASASCSTLTQPRRVRSGVPERGELGQRETDEEIITKIFQSLRKIIKPHIKNLNQSQAQQILRKLKSLHVMVKLYGQTSQNYKKESLKNKKKKKKKKKH